MSGLSWEAMNHWRQQLKTQLLSAAEISGYQLQVINPVEFYNFEEKRHQSEKEIQDYDLAHVTSTDLILVNLEGLNSSDGTKLELRDANYHNRIPVIAFGNRVLYENLHPWIKSNITRIMFKRWHHEKKQPQNKKNIYIFFIRPWCKHRHDQKAGRARRRKNQP